MSNFIHQMSNSKVKFECQMSNYKCQILIKAGKNYFSKITHFCRELKFLAKFTYYCFKNISHVFQECSISVSEDFQGCFKPNFLIKYL